MKNTVIAILITVVVVTAAGTAMYLKKYNSATVPTVSAKSIVASSTPEIHHINLESGKANPADVLIKIGDYVEFDSKDGKTHDIASGKGNDYGKHHDHTATDGIESGPFAPDEGFKVQFKQIGLFFFHDHLNPNIAISVAVYDPAKK